MQITPASRLSALVTHARHNLFLSLGRRTPGAMRVVVRCLTLSFCLARRA